MRLGVVLALACSAVFCARAQEKPAERGQRLVTEALQALGGDAFLRMENRVETGRAYSFYRSALTGLDVAKIYTRYAGRGDTAEAGKLRVSEREAFGKKEEAAVLFTPEGAWELSFRGARPLADERYANFKDSTLRSIFYILHERLHEPGLTFMWQGADMFENRPVEIVSIADADNQTVTVYFSQSEKLPVRQVFRRRNPLYKDFDTETTVFANYRAVGGVKWPFNIRRERNGDKIYEMFSESVEIDQRLPDNLFTLPGNVKMLPKLD
ncbi:MAG: hypothetical protein ABSF25_24755 [Bryobacteraceae bacterium]|jgi:hypothetical protein